MKFIGILVSAVLITGFGVPSAEATVKPPVLPTKTHAGISIGSQIVTVGNRSRKAKSRAAYVCSTIKGISYGAALVGIQSTMIVIPSLAIGVGAPVTAIATGVGVVATAVGFATMVAHDAVCR